MITCFQGVAVLFEGRRPLAGSGLGAPDSRLDRDSTPDELVFNRTVALRDTWAKIEKALTK